MAHEIGHPLSPVARQQLLAARGRKTLSRSQRRYRRRRAAKQCVSCGQPNDQQPYVRCSRCYAPSAHPHQPRRYGVDSRHPEYRKRYYAEQKAARFTATTQLACSCGPTFYTVTTLPFRCPRCGRVFASMP
jgi:DNA-directed RNA polymerase subunit RPC12/RpoP